VQIGAGFAGVTVREGLETSILEASMSSKLGCVARRGSVGTDEPKEVESGQETVDG
jgi:hypothetical protein